MYLVWKQQEYTETWERHACETDQELQDTILDLIKSAGVVEVTVPMDYRISVKVTEKPAEPRKPAAKQPAESKVSETEEVKSETDQGEPAASQGAGGESNIGDGRGDRSRVQKSSK